MKMLNTLIPPPLVTLLFGLILWGLSYLEFGFSNDNLISSQVRLSVCVLLITIGGFFSIAGVLSFKRAKTTVNPLKPHEASSLVSSGIYRFTRNPMYVGFAFFLIAFSVFLGSLLIVLILPIFMLYLTYFQIIPEERALEKIFSESFIEYKNKVRRWL